MKIVLIVLFVFVFLIIIPRLIMIFNASRMKGKEAATLHKASGNRIRSGKKTVLYFYTPSCGACKMQGPIITRIKKQHSNAVFKIDASQNREAATAYGVMGVPFIVFIENCKIMRAMAGVQSESTIKNFLAE